jgi:hypothetical protein
MKLIAYQALISNPQNITRVRVAKAAIEQAGGRVSIAPPTTVGMVVVILELPEDLRPEQFCPGVPFFPM